MHSGSHITVQQRLSLDFITLKHACPQGIYVAPVPEKPLAWTGVAFIRKGPYARAVLRFDINFTSEYPARPPIITFATDVFHPLVAPLTTYTYTSRDRGVETISAADDEKLPPGGLTLRHGFPEWYEQNATEISAAAITAGGDPGKTDTRATSTPFISINTKQATVQPPHIVEVLQYIRVIFDTDALIDSVPLEVAANPGAWHAWKSYRSRMIGLQAESPHKSLISGNDGARDRSMSPGKQQPGGARRPGEWNWTGVWEERVKKAIQASISDTTLFGGEESKVIDFVQLNDEMYGRLEPVLEARSSPAVQ